MKEFPVIMKRIDEDETGHVAEMKRPAILKNDC
jgi:hypothetical protein